MYSGKNSTKRPAARPVLPWRRKIYSTGIDKSGYCSVAQWLSDEEDRLTTKTTYDSICPKAKDADEEGGDDAEEPASMGHCTHYSGMATARCRRTRRNGVGRWSGRVTIMQGGMAEQQKGTDDAMMQRLQPSQVMTRELQLTKPSGAKNGACGCAHSRWPAQPQGDEAEEWSFVPRICPCAISRSAKCPRCFSSSFLVLDKNKDRLLFTLSVCPHRCPRFPVFTLHTDPEWPSVFFSLMAFSQSKHVRVLPPMRHAQPMASRWGTFRSIGLNATAQGQQGNEPVDPER